MRSRIYLLAFLMAVCFCSAASANLILNPGFEDGTNEVPWNEGIWPENWSSATDWGWAAWKNTSQGLSGDGATFAHTGTSCIVVGGWQNNDWGKWYQENIPVTGGKTYALGAWYCSEGWGTSLNTTLEITWRDDTGAYIDKNWEWVPIEAGQIDWRYFEMVAAAPANAVTCMLEIIGYPSASPLYDDLSFDLVTFATAPVPADGIGVPASSTTTLSWTNPEPAAAGDTVESYVTVSSHGDPNTSSPYTFNATVIAESGAWIAGETINLAALVDPLTLADNEDYFWRVDSKNVSTAGDVITIGNVWSFNTANLAPTVDAGLKQNAWLSGGSTTVQLAGSASDDGLPNPPANLTLTWSGSGATFSDINAADSTATFTSAGTYVLTLTADDDPDDLDPYGQDATDTVTIIVYGPLQSRLVAEWNLDADATEATDAGKNGTLVGEAVIDNTEFKVGTGSALFDGVDDYIDIAGSGYGTDANIVTWADLTDEVSMTLWIKSNGMNEGWEPIIGKGLSGYRIQRNEWTDQGFFAIGKAGIADNEKNVAGVQNLNDGKWHHLAATNNGEVMAFYVDGVLEGESDITDMTQPFPTNGTNFRIGTAADGNGFNGYIDQVRLYDRGLSQKKIRDQFVADGGSSSCGQTYSASGADLNQDCYVGLADFVIIAAEWLDCTDIASTVEYGGKCVELP